jgi:hypothetical protein
MVEHLLEENCVKIVENEETLSDGVVWAHFWIEPS